MEPLQIGGQQLERRPFFLKILVTIVMSLLHAAQPMGLDLRTDVARALEARQQCF
jgi:hypothetical protein